MLKEINTYFKLKRKLNFLSLSHEQIEKIQLHKLKKLVEHAYATVPYYHDLFIRNNIRPHDIKTLEDIKRIPVSSKEDFLRVDREQLCSTIFKKRDLRTVKSSGTTGEPFLLYIDSNYAQTLGADALRSKMMHGLRLTDKILKIGGDNNVIRKRKNPLYHFLLKRATLSSFCKPHEILAFYNSFKPEVVRGYISSLYSFALWLETQRMVLKHKPKFILCSAETVHDFMKQKISEIFQTKIIDRYATVELGIVADQCEHEDGYHIFEDSVLAEIIELDSKNYFVGTNLDNYAMPFIRYNTRDICDPWPAQERECSCGMQTRKLKRIIGRDNDFITLPTGGFIAPIDLIFFLRNWYPFITKFRFTQDYDTRLRLEVIVTHNTDEELFNGIIHKFRLITQDIKLEVVKVDDIPPDSSGKMRIVRSELCSVENQMGKQNGDLVQNYKTLQSSVR
jgi:phenylacetate-CoA ligase